MLKRHKAIVILRTEIISIFSLSKYKKASVNPSRGNTELSLQSLNEKDI
jgi:hypothetical protein